jgi:hypothetical protein
VIYRGPDIERSPVGSPNDTQSDPFRFRSGLKTDDELAEIRHRRKTGKKLENYQRKQNDVRLRSHSFDGTHKLYSSLPRC